MLKTSMSDKNINMKNLFFSGICLLLFSCVKDNGITSGNNGTTSSGCIDTNCSDYTSQAAAQAAFDADPECRSDLDADNDGIACEEPGNSVTICPTTSNCGCSGKNKSPCQADPCCKWVVGSGCECA